MKAEDMSHQECELFLECILDITRMMLEAGNEAQRVERIALRIMDAYGFTLCCAYAMSAKVDISIKAPDGCHYTQSVRVLSTGTDLGRLERLTRMAYKICDNQPTVDEIRRMIDTEHQHKNKVLPEMLGFLATAFFYAIFFGGDIRDGAAAILVSAPVYGLNLALNRQLHNSQSRLLFTFLASFLSGCLALWSVRLGLGHHADKIMIGEVMLLIPGLSLVNGVRELFYRDIVTGTYRLVEALILAVAIAAGFGVAIILLGGGLA